MLHALLPTVHVQLHSASFLAILDVQIICYFYHIPASLLALVFFNLCVSAWENIHLSFIGIFLIFNVSTPVSPLQSAQQKKSTAFPLYHNILLFSWLTLLTICSHCIMCLFIWLMSICSYEMCQKETEPDICLRWQDRLYSDYYSRLRDTSIN